MFGYTQRDLSNRLDHLYSISRYKDNDVAKMFNAVRSVFSTYFGRGKSNEEFRIQSFNTFKKVVMDGLYRNVECSHMDLVPEKDLNYPIGYLNVGNIFRAEIFQDIMAIKDSDFNAAYYRTQIGNDGNSGAIQYETHNTYLENWTKTVKASMQNELEALRRLEQYCLYSYEKISMAFIFEEIGNVWQSYTEEKEVYAEKIYIQRGWDWFEQTFEVGLFEPSYIDKLRRKRR